MTDHYNYRLLTLFLQGRKACNVSRSLASTKRALFLWSFFISDFLQVLFKPTRESCLCALMGQGPPRMLLGRLWAREPCLSLSPIFGGSLQAILVRIIRQKSLYLPCLSLKQAPHIATNLILFFFFFFFISVFGEHPTAGSDRAYTPKLPANYITCCTLSIISRAARLYMRYKFSGTLHFTHWLEGKINF